MMAAFLFSDLLAQQFLHLGNTVTVSGTMSVHTVTLRTGQHPAI